MSVRLQSGICFYTKELDNDIKNKECSICRQLLNDDSIYAKEENYFSKIKKGICCHAFHSECIDPWIKNNNKCPICANKFI